MVRYAISATPSAQSMRLLTTKSGAKGIQSCEHAVHSSMPSAPEPTSSAAASTARSAGMPADERTAQKPMTNRPTAVTSTAAIGSPADQVSGVNPGSVTEASAGYVACGRHHMSAGARNAPKATVTASVTRSGPNAAPDASRRPSIAFERKPTQAMPKPNADVKNQYGSVQGRSLPAPSNTSITAGVPAGHPYQLVPAPQASTAIPTVAKMPKTISAMRASRRGRTGARPSGIDTSAATRRPAALYEWWVARETESMSIDSTGTSNSMQHQAHSSAPVTAVINRMPLISLAPKSSLNVAVQQMCVLKARYRTLSCCCVRLSVLHHRPACRRERRMRTPPLGPPRYPRAEPSNTRSRLSSRP